MRPLLLSALLLTLIHSASSQTTIQPWLGAHVSTSDFGVGNVVKYTSTLSGGVQAGMALSPRWRVRAGLGFVQLGDRIDSGTLRFGSQWNGNTFDPTLPPGVSSLTTTNRAVFAAVPLDVEYTFASSEKWSLDGYLGVTGLYGLFETSRARAEGRNQGSSRQRLDNVLQLGVQAGLTVSRRLTERIAVFVRPNYLKSLSFEAQRRPQFAAFGLHVGSSFVLGSDVK